MTGGHPQSGRPVPGHRHRPPRPSSSPAPGTGGPAANAAALLFLPPVLSLVHLHPALYLLASILILLTPARNSASLPAPPCRLPPATTTTPTTGAASTPRWTHRRRTTGRGPPSPRLRRLHHPQRGGGRGAEHCALSFTPGIMQTLCRVPPHGHPSLSSSSAGDLRGGSGGGGGCQARRQRGRAAALNPLLRAVCGM